jgi:hypothetical protein
VVLGDGEHHNAADAALGFLGNCGCIRSLRLHPHAETDKKAVTKLLTKDEARRIAANIAKLPELLGSSAIK